MKFTDRDVRLVRDIALSHVLSRDQIIRLGYFTSVSRCNRTMCRLQDSGVVSVLTTPFFTQRLYTVGAAAVEVLGERIARLLTFRTPSPRYLQHAIATTEVRLALTSEGGTDWRFEPQLRHAFSWAGRTHEVRPDGYLLVDGRVTVLEVDLGNVSHTKFGQKLRAFDSYLRSGAFSSAYGASTFDVLTLTTGSLRCSRLKSLAPRSEVCFQFHTFDELGIAIPGGWS